MTSKYHKYESPQINSQFIVGRRPAERLTYSFNDSGEKIIASISTRNLDYKTPR